MAHYFPHDVKLGLLAHSRSFLANQKPRNAIVGVENLIKYDSPCSAKGGKIYDRYHSVQSSNQPIKTRSKLLKLTLKLTQSAGKRVPVSHEWFLFTSDWIRKLKKVRRIFNTIVHLA